jgi:type II secretory pathway predicted ATPase ExeA
MQMPVPFYSGIALKDFKERIIELNDNKGIKPILIIDEAQELDTQTLICLKTFLNYQMDSKNYLYVILSGQKNLMGILNLYPLESIFRRIRIKYFIQPLTLGETSEYISHQMKACGLQNKIFPDDVKAEIYKNSKGNISRVNNICFSSIIIAASKSKELIDMTVFDSVLAQEKSMEA